MADIVGFRQDAIVIFPTHFLFAAAALSVARSFDGRAVVFLAVYRATIYSISYVIGCAAFLCVARDYYCTVLVLFTRTTDSIIVVVTRP